MLRVQLLITPEPTLIRSVTAAYAAIGTMASRTSRDSACQTASKPCCFGITDVLQSIAQVVCILQVKRNPFSHGTSNR